MSEAARKIEEFGDPNHKVSDFSKNARKDKDTDETKTKAYSWVTGNRSSAGVELVSKEGHRVGLQYGNMLTPVMETQEQIILFSSMTPIKVVIEGRALGKLCSLLTACQPYRIREQDDELDDGDEDEGFVSSIRIEEVGDGDEVKAIKRLFGIDRQD